MSRRNVIRRTTIGLFGGMFDPIHIGHLRVALELKHKLALDEMRLLPCHIPPHREQPVASIQHRLHMAQRAVANCPDLQIDDLETRNSGPSFSIRTVEAVRQQVGPEVSLCMAIGMDSLVKLNTWYRWQELLQHAHIIVAARPGWQEPKEGEMADYVRDYRGTSEDLVNYSCGRIVIETVRLLPVSSTEIRAAIAEGKSPQFLLPEAVWDYIQQQHLYQNQ